MPGPVCSGMNSATSRESSTEQAPNRNGGPGMMALCKERRIQASGLTRVVTTGKEDYHLCFGVSFHRIWQIV